MYKLYPLIIATYVLTVLSVTGCALSPQTVAIVPDLDSNGTTASTGKRLSIQVRDGRTNTIIGYRGGIYATAAIATADDLTDSIAREVAQAFSGSGYMITEADAADIRLVLDIDTLDYKAQQNKIIWDIELFAAIRATVTSAGGEKTLQLQDRYTKQFAKAPSTAENENLINDVISKLLQRLVENNEFMAI